MDKIPLKFLQFQAQLRLAHWQVPKGEPIHRALGELYDDVSSMADDIIEVIQGKYNTRIKIGSIKNLQLADYETISLNKLCDDMCDFLCDGIWKEGISKEKDDEIANMIQDVKARIYKFKYLISL